MSDEENYDPFECVECGLKIYRNCVDDIAVCLLCELEEKAQRQLVYETPVLIEVLHKKFDHELRTGVWLGRWRVPQYLLDREIARRRLLRERLGVRL